MSFYHSNNHILFKSRCRLHFVLYCPFSLMEFLEEEIQTHLVTDDSDDDDVCLLHQTIVQGINTWLIRTGRTISIRQVNTFRSRTHYCESNSIPSLQTINKISTTIVQAIMDPEGSHSINTEYPMDGNPCLEITCSPTFSRIRSKTSNMLLMKCADYILDQPNVTTKVGSLVISWMIRCNCRFAVETPLPYQQQGPLFVFVPNTIFPFLEILQQEIHATLTSHKKNTLTMIQSPTRPSNQKHNVSRSSLFFHPYPTRKRNQQMAKYLQSASCSKIKINYQADPNRHMPGTPPKLTAIHHRHFPPVPKLDPEQKEKQLSILLSLLRFHQHLQDQGIVAPRDNWERWMDDYLETKVDKEDTYPPDRAFMCLVIIIMSSSTTDSQLGKIIPRLFSIGITSSSACIEIAIQYGMDAFCSLISESGRYYLNAERIVNCADYFIQYHDGTIPRDISLAQFERLIGIGHKTAMIVISSSFGRNEGIPCDIHVFRWCYHLHWSKGYKMENDSFRCSHLLTSWIPSPTWPKINPLFGSLGQLLQSKDSASKVMASLDNFNNNTIIRSTMNTMARVYL